jgi:putative peptidoglycan lipid II flippase
MGEIFGRLSLVSSLTLLSRFLGLARDVLFFGCFGASVVGEAFILAFTFPNLFRRMLGEGTLSSAFIPVFSELLNKSKDQALLLLSQVTSRLFVFLGVFSVLICLLSYYGSVSDWGDQAKWSKGLFLNSISFGYVVLICASAIMVGALNSTGKFFEGAFSPVLLNLCMISSMVFGKYFFALEMTDIAVLLCSSVLVAGVLQLALPWLKLRTSMGWRLQISMSESNEMNQIKSLFWVGALGAAVGQVNILISRLLAYSLDDSGGLSYLFLSSRLVELPLGVFAIAISTVFFPEMTKSAGDKDRTKFLQTVAIGLRLTAGVTIPAAAGLAFLSSPILTALFQWGEFGAEEVERAKDILVISSFGLPFYAISSFLVKVYHSKKNMSYPLQAAIVSMLCNLIFCLLLISDYQVEGLAWANVLAAAIQTFYLAVRLQEVSIKDLLRNRPYFPYSIILSTVVLSLVLSYSDCLSFVAITKIESIIFLLFIIPVGVIIYGVSLSCLGFPEARAIVRKFWR